MESVCVEFDENGHIRTVPTGEDSPHEQPNDPRIYVDFKDPNSSPKTVAPLGWEFLRRFFQCRKMSPSDAALEMISAPISFMFELHSKQISKDIVHYFLKSFEGDNRADNVYIFSGYDIPELKQMWETLFQSCRNFRKTCTLDEIDELVQGVELWYRGVIEFIFTSTEDRYDWTNLTKCISQHSSHSAIEEFCTQLDNLIKFHDDIDEEFFIANILTQPNP